MRKVAQKKPEDARPGDATTTARPQGDAEDRPKSILPPPDPKLDGTQKRGLSVFRRGPGAA
jgi:hypothetical protein